MSIPLIELQAVSRSFGSLQAVRDVSFHVDAGEIVGFLGANGAGKSTILRMLSGYLPPTSGKLRVAGLDTKTQALRARAAVGYLTEHNALYETMRVDRFLEFMADVRGIRLDEPARARLRQSFQLEAVWSRPISSCSKGYRQRIGLAAALLHEPPVLLLDEPTHGLDPLQVASLRDFLHQVRPGRAILFSSHVLAEVAQIADRLLLLQGGRLVLDAPVRELRERAEREQRSLEALVLEQLGPAGEAAHREEEGVSA